jgi:hypothetical protein
MNTYERAAQLWQILISAAHNRQVLTYEIVGKLTGLQPLGLANFLNPVLHYCENNKLPLLPILVVSKESGKPGQGFPEGIGLDAERERVFAHNWFAMKPPAADDFKA